MESGVENRTLSLSLRPPLSRRTVHWLLATMRFERRYNRRRVLIRKIIFIPPTKHAQNTREDQDQQEGTAPGAGGRHDNHVLSTIFFFLLSSFVFSSAIGESAVNYRSKWPCMAHTWRPFSPHPSLVLLSLARSLPQRLNPRRGKSTHDRNFVLWFEIKASIAIFISHNLYNFPPLPSPSPAPPPLSPISSKSLKHACFHSVSLPSCWYLDEPKTKYLFLIGANPSYRMMVIRKDETDIYI